MHFAVRLVAVAATTFVPTHPCGRLRTAAIRIWMSSILLHMSPLSLQPSKDCRDTSTTAKFMYITITVRNK